MNNPLIPSEEQRNANTGRYIDAVVRLRVEASLQQARVETAREIFDDLWSKCSHGYYAKAFCRVCVAACKAKYLGESQ